MLTYMTPERYRVAGKGIDLSGYEDVELASVLSNATTMVNAHCAVPRLPQLHSFAGGEIVGERHTWAFGNEVMPSRRRFYPWHKPVREITGFRILLTEGQYIEIDPANLFINNSEGYVEVVALAMGVGVFPVVANLSLNQPVAEMDYTYGYSFQVQGETLYETDADIFRAQHQFWSGTPTIYLNGSDETANFEVDAIEGTARTLNQLTATDVVTADYSYTLPDNIAAATAVIATDLLSESNLARKGMSGLLEIQVAEVRLRRPTPTALLTREQPPISREAITLLDGYVFRSAA